MTDRSIRAWDVVVVDVEATGLSAARDRLVEVAVVRGRDGEIHDRYSSLVNPGRPMGATEVHGITEAMVASAPRVERVLAEVLPRLEGAVLVGHRASVDLRFLHAEAARAGLTVPVTPVVDTLGLGRRFPAPNRQLGPLCAWFGVAIGAAHRALADAEATWALLWRMVERLEASGPVTVAELERQGRLDERGDERRLVLGRIRAAIQAKGRVGIVYEAGGPGGERSEREITPLRVNRREVRAFCHLRDAERTFRLDRMWLRE